jgi:hypothetical protein
MEYDYIVYLFPQSYAKIMTFVTHRLTAYLMEHNAGQKMQHVVWVLSWSEISIWCNLLGTAARVTKDDLWHHVFMLQNTIRYTPYLVSV